MTMLVDAISTTSTNFDLRIVTETFLLIIILLLVKPINSFSGFAASKVR